MRRCIFLAMAAMLLLGGCASQYASREAETMNAFVGEPVGFLVQEMGTPAITEDLPGGGQLYRWQGCRMVFDWNGEQYPRYCQTSVWVSPEGLVTRWNWWGNECPLDGAQSGCDSWFWQWH